MNIRAEFGLEIIMIRNMEESEEGIKDRPGFLPSADYIIKPGDRLLILGTVDDISKFKRGIK